MKKYNQYKNSGVEWLGEIPEHWEITRLKNIFFESVTQNVDGKCKFNLSLLKDIGVIPFSEKGNKGNKSSLDTRNYRLVKKGDIVLNTTNVCIGSVGLSKYDGCMSSVMYIVLRPHIEIDIRYYDYVFKVRGFQKYLRRISNGILEIREYLDKTLFMAETMIIPDINEQSAIANFLSDKTTKIEQAITIKQKQIKMLKERRQILIHKAVTRGLNENVKLKDSGVEWIGEIPEHWEVKKLGYLANCFPSNIDKHSKINEKVVRLCNYTDVYKNDYITDEMDLMIATATSEQISKFVLKKGDIIITKDSETASDIAVPAYVKEDLTNVVCGYHLAMIRTYQESYSKYLFRALQTKAFNTQFEICSNGITRVGLGSSDLKNGYFLVPSKLEQTEIAEFIEIGTTKIATAISLKEREIEKMKEYKMSLIDGVVTGKIKVS